MYRFSEVYAMNSQSILKSRARARDRDIVRYFRVWHLEFARGGMSASRSAITDVFC
jgi:hypothetical protein